MLRSVPQRLGRWSPRDFMRGRTKKGGAIHIRHTHGKLGRYKRLSSKYGLRDGRRHAANHMQGGLGVKLGGGLFGLRIPRQHALSTMSRDEYDIALYGHPNITNPYRHVLEAHPSLEDVMQNAPLSLKLVVLLPRTPRVPRTPSAAGDAASSLGGASLSSSASIVPPAWRAVAEQVSAALTATAAAPSGVLCKPATGGAACVSKALAGVHVFYTTREASVSLDAGTSTAETLTANSLQALARLYANHQQGRRLVLHHHSQSYNKRSVAARAAATAPSSVADALRRVPLMGPALRAAPPASPRVGPRPPLLSLSSRAPAVVRGVSRSSPSEHASILRKADGGLQRGGVQAVLLDLWRTNLNAIFVCTRPPAPLASSSVQSPSPSASSSLTGRDAAVSRKLDHRLGAARQGVLQRSGTDSPAVLSATSGASSTASTAASKRALLKTDVDADEEAGVWSAPRSHLSDVLRWNVFRNDPRAHHRDALPHNRRQQFIVALVDYSKLNGVIGAAARPLSSDGSDAAHHVMTTARPHATLLSRQTNKTLEQMGFKALHAEDLRDTLSCLRSWSVDYQWSRVALRAPQSEKNKPETHQSVM